MDWVQDAWAAAIVSAQSQLDVDEAAADADFVTATEEARVAKVRADEAAQLAYEQAVGGEGLAVEVDLALLAAAHRQSETASQAAAFSQLATTSPNPWTEHAATAATLAAHHAVFASTAEVARLSSVQAATQARALASLTAESEQRIATTEAESAQRINQQQVKKSHAEATRDQNNLAPPANARGGDGNKIDTSAPKPYNEGRSTYRKRFKEALFEAIERAHPDDKEKQRVAKEIIEALLSKKGENGKYLYNVHHEWQFVHARHGENFRKWLYESHGVNVNDVDNLAAVPDHIHEVISKEQGKFWDKIKKEAGVRNLGELGEFLSRPENKDRSDKVFKDYRKFNRDLRKRFRKYSIKVEAPRGVINWFKGWIRRPAGKVSLDDIVEALSHAAGKDALDLTSSAKVRSYAKSLVEVSEELNSVKAGKLLRGATVIGLAVLPVIMGLSELPERKLEFARLRQSLEMQVATALHQKAANGAVRKKTVERIGELLADIVNVLDLSGDAQIVQWQILLQAYTSQHKLP